jgi:(E)-4-hydroxy-3-methyl-but-2-enyl pyrophosphate reductase
MEIRIAKTAGFCMGVRRAVEMVFDLAACGGEAPLYTFGPLIHNSQVLELLRQKGIAILDHIPQTGHGTVVIRAHGVPPQITTRLEQAGFEVKDATCPRVVKIQRIIQASAENGAETIIIGDRDHPEVIGLQGYARGRGHVVGDLETLRALPHFNRAVVVAQSTQNTAFFETARQWVMSNRPEYKVYHTICDSTEKRQAEVRHLATEVDAVIVVGGRTSGNTRRLVEIAHESGKPAWHIETDRDLHALDRHLLTSAGTIGITAGASTPNWVIKRVARGLIQLPMQRKFGLSKCLFRLQRLLLLTNLYVALAAGCLAYACSTLEGVSGNLPFFFLSTFYVLSMHTINHLTGQGAQQYNDPERAAFYRDHRTALAGLATTAAISGMLVAASIGVWAWIVYALMSLMGFGYHWDILPARLTRSRFRRISDIPVSKVLLVTIAWPVLAVLVPPLSIRRTFGWVHLVLFLWAGGLAFARTAFNDILDMQGDRIVGKKTIALILGEKKLLRLLNGLLIGLIGMLTLAAALHWVQPVAFGITLGPIFFFFLLQAYRIKHILPGVRLEMLAESHFIMVGLIAAAWPLQG